MHQFTSAHAGYRKSLEGWAKAGIRNVEPWAGLLDDYLETDSLASAKRVLTDNDLAIVSGAIGVTGLWEPNPNFSKNLIRLGNAANRANIDLLCTAIFQTAPHIYAIRVTRAN
jgi:hypothetical protein